MSLGVHLLLLAVISAQLAAPKPPEAEPMQVGLVDAQMLSSIALPTPAPPTPTETPPEPEPKPEPKPAKPQPKTSLSKPLPRRTVYRPAPPQVATLPPGDLAKGDTVAELSDAELAGATTAASGSTGRPCDMVRWLQAALRKDPKIHAAIAQSRRGGRAIRVWNGDWVRSTGEEGAGLAGVREAIMVEIAFAPEACRVTEPMHNLVLISLNDGPGATQLALGSGHWKWSDLLTPRAMASDYRVARQ